MASRLAFKSVTNLGSSDCCASDTDVDGVSRTASFVGECTCILAKVLIPCNGKQVLVCSLTSFTGTEIVFAVFEEILVAWTGLQVAALLIPCMCKYRSSCGTLLRGRDFDLTALRRVR